MCREIERLLCKKADKHHTSSASGVAYAETCGATNLLKSEPFLLFLAAPIPRPSTQLSTSADSFEPIESLGS